MGNRLRHCPRNESHCHVACRCGGGLPWSLPALWHVRVTHVVLRWDCHCSGAWWRRRRLKARVDDGLVVLALAGWQQPPRMMHYGRPAWPDKRIARQRRCPSARGGRLSAAKTK